MTLRFHSTLRSFLSSRGWHYYRWTDAFTTDLIVSMDFEAFLARIGWEHARTLIRCWHNLTRADQPER